jgi:putative FmdB family regulatory protein
MAVLPTYEYRCVACEHQFERFQRMSDDPVKVCEKCGEPVKRLLFPVAIQFKGNGFYTTDYARRNALSSASPQGNGGGGLETSERTSTSEGSPADTKPETAKPAAPAPAVPASGD